ncbi:MAG: hypothetical protein GX294_07765 [Candidatus Cloacimonetes bacterium]|nr:hypothetical protein [Candidatus Cloacimonadota bacterium]
MDLSGGFADFSRLLLYYQARKATAWNPVESSLLDDIFKKGELSPKAVIKDFLIAASDDRIRVEASFINETIWISAKQMADLFQIDITGIRRHLKNIFESGELVRNSVSAFFALTE